MKFLFLAALFCFPTLAAQDPQLVNLLKQNATEQTLCRKTQSDLENLTHSSPTSDSEPLKDKTTALKVLEILEGFQGRMTVYKTLMQRAVAKGAAITEDDFAITFENERCGEVWIFYKGLERLFHSTKKLSFSPAERARVEHVTLAYVGIPTKKPDLLMIFRLQLKLLQWIGTITT